MGRGVARIFFLLAYPMVHMISFMGSIINKVLSGKRVEIYLQKPQWKEILFRFHVRPLLVVIGLFSLIGCVTAPNRLDQELSMAAEQSYKSFSVAVLPFVDKTDSNGLANLVRYSFYGHLSVRPYRDIELHLIDRKLSEYNLTNLKTLSSKNVSELGRLLECDALILGEITTYQKVFLGIYSQVAVGATISIWDTRSGQVIWQDQHVARFHDGGIPFSLVEIPFISFRSGWNLRERVKIRTVDDLSRHLASRIPGPDIILYMSKLTKPAIID